MTCRLMIFLFPFCFFCFVEFRLIFTYCPKCCHCLKALSHAIALFRHLFRSLFNALVFFALNLILKSD